MWKIIFPVKKSRKKVKEAKTLILKEVFNSANQKKAITKAAIESAQDQNDLLLKYRKSLEQ